MKFSVIQESDVAEVIDFVEQGTATPWTRKSWFGSRNSGVVARSQGLVCGVLPLRPLKMRIGESVKTAYYCSAVRVAPKFRNLGIGSRMMEFACDHFITMSSFLVVVRDDPKGSAYRWYVANGFDSVAKVVSYLHLRSHDELTLGPSTNIQVSSLDVPSSAQNWEWDRLLLREASTTNGSTELDAIDVWRRRMDLHYYSAAYSEHKVFQVTTQGLVLLGLAARTQMRNEPRVDILDFVYRGEGATTSFQSAAQLAVVNLTSDVTKAVFWNLNVLEAMQLGVADKWESRWQTEILTRGLTSDDRNEIDASFWKYRQLDFV